MNLALPVPKAYAPFFFVQPPLIIKSLGKWQGKEHLNTTPTPSLLYVLFQSFSISKGFLSFFLFYLKKSTLKLDVDVRIPGDPPSYLDSIWGQEFQSEFEVNPFQCRVPDLPLPFGKPSLVGQQAHTWEIKAMVAE